MTIPSSLSTVRQSGFSLIELMIVITIIIILTSLVFATMSIFRRSQMQATTQMTMGQLSRALTTYQDHYGRFGTASDASDFIADPLEFLVRRRQALGLQELFTAGNKNWGRADVPAGQRYALVNDPLPGITTTPFSASFGSLDTATHVLDGFGNPFLITILNRTVDGSAWSRPSVIILSSTRGDPNDDEYIEMYYNDGAQIVYNGRGYPGSDGTWDLFDAEKYIVTAIDGADGGATDGGGADDGGGDEPGDKGKGKKK